MQREQYSLFWEANWNVGKSTIGVHHVESENIGRSMPLTADERKQIKANKANNNKLPGYTADWSKLSKAMLDPDFLAFMPRDARTLESTNTTYSAKYEVPLNTHYLVVGTEYLDAQMKDGVFGMDKGQTNDKKNITNMLYLQKIIGILLILLHLHWELDMINTKILVTM